MALITRNCKICGSDSKSIFIEGVDYSISKEKFDIKICNKCSFVYTDPVPLEAELGRYYQSENYISHSNINKGLINNLYQLIRNHTLGKKVNLINRINGNRKGILLDIGCGTGHFIEKAKKNGWKVEGYEPDTSARKTAEDIVKQEIKKSILEIKNEKYDLITLWHVLEHIYDLDETMVKIKSLLNKDGHILIAVPNYESKDAKLYGKYWAAYDLPRHLYHFSKASLQKLLNKYNLKVQQTLPMPFDSFYVSLMSEKYKGNTSIISTYYNSFLTGLISNKEKNNNSSILYIVGHS